VHRKSARAGLLRVATLCNRVSLLVFLVVLAVGSHNADAHSQEPPAAMPPTAAASEFDASEFDAFHPAHGWITELKEAKKKAKSGSSSSQNDQLRLARAFSTLGKWSECRSAAMLGVSQLQSHHPSWHRSKFRFCIAKCAEQLAHVEQVSSVDRIEEHLNCNENHLNCMVHQFPPVGQINVMQQFALAGDAPMMEQLIARGGCSIDLGCPCGGSKNPSEPGWGSVLHLMLVGLAAQAQGILVPSCESREMPLVAAQNARNSSFGWGPTRTNASLLIRKEQLPLIPPGK